MQAVDEPPKDTAAAVAEKVGTLETATELLRFLRGAPDTAPSPEDSR